MTSYELALILLAINARHGEASAKMATDALRAYHWKKRLAAYHYSECNKVLLSESQDVLRDGSIGPTHVWAAMMMAPARMEQAKLVCESHVVGAAHAMHSLADIVAHVVYGALGFEANASSRLKPQRISAITVQQKLAKAGGSASIAKALDSLLDSEEFLYLDAYVNTIKHVNFLPMNISCDFTVNSGAKLAAFDRHGRKYEAKWATDFLEELNVVSGSICELIQAIVASLD